MRAEIEELKLFQVGESLNCYFLSSIIYPPVDAWQFNCLHSTMHVTVYSVQILGLNKPL
jgi:hypothetical protein